MVEAIVGVALRAILASVLLGGVLAGLVLLATRTLSLNAATRHGLWTTALIATAMMPLAGIGMSLARAAAPAFAPPPSPAVTTSTLAAITPKSQSAPKHEAAAAMVPSHAHPTVATAPAGPALADRLAFTRATPRVPRGPALVVVAIWIAGALIGLIGLAASIVRVRGLKRRSSPLDGTLADDLPWLTEVDAGREIYLRLSFETETPVAIGFRRPVILIPTELATADGLAAIEQLVLHEHAHLRRYDDWTNLIQRTIERIFWFNPIVWMVGRKIALEREIASDDAVVDKTGEAHAYATSLWKLAREMRMPEHAVVAPGALLTRKQITIRIEQLLDKKRGRLHRSPITALGVGLAGMLAVVFVATSAPAVELPAAAVPANVIAAPPAQWHVDDSARLAKAHAAPHPASGVHALKPAADLAPPSASGKRAAKPGPFAVEPREQRVFRILETPPSPPSSKQPAIETDRAVVGAVPAVAPLPPLPALPPAQAGPALPSLSPTALHKIRVAADAAAARARRVHETDGIATDVAKAIHEVVVSLPRELAHDVAQDGSTAPARTRTDGLKLTRDLIASCTGCSFRNADGRGLDLHGIKIHANDFTGADLRGVNLSGAQLVGVSLAGANLANADLRNAQLHGVELRGANFDGAQLEGTKLVGMSVRRVSLRGTVLRSLIATCTGCDFTGMDLHGQDLHGITLTGADLSRADLHEANLSGVRFSGVNLVRANLTGADLSNARFDGCDLTGVDLRGARTTGMTIQGSGMNG